MYKIKAPATRWVMSQTYAAFDHTAWIKAELRDKKNQICLMENFTEDAPRGLEYLEDKHDIRRHFEPEFRGHGMQ